MEKKINSKQIAEIPALPIKKEVEKPPQNLQPLPDKKFNEPKQPENLGKSSILPQNFFYYYNNRRGKFT